MVTGYSMTIDKVNILGDQLQGAPVSCSCTFGEIHPVILFLFIYALKLSILVSSNMLCSK
jgi:hypothetical protein